MAEIIQYVENPLDPVSRAFSSGGYRDVYENAIARFISHLYKNGPIYFAILPAKDLGQITQWDLNDLRAFYKRLLEYMNNNYKFRIPGINYEKDFGPSVKYVLVLNRKVKFINFYKYED